MRKPKIKITLADRIVKCSCHRGHKIGDTFNYDTDRGKLCPMAMHAVFPYIDILRYGGTPPTSSNGEIRFCCPISPPQKTSRFFSGSILSPLSAIKPIIFHPFLELCGLKVLSIPKK